MSQPERQTSPLFLALAGASLALTGCQSKSDAPKSEKEKVPAATTKAGEIKAPAPTGANPECMPRWDESGTPGRIDLGGRWFVQQGTKLSELDGKPDKKLRLGVFADTNEDTPDNLENIKQLMDFFKKEKVEAIVIPGDLGENESQITNVLKVVLEAKLPTFALVGNRERAKDFNAAVKALQEKNSHLINLNHTRIVILDDAALLSIPGYWNKAYLHAGAEGCTYTKEDIDALDPAVKAAEGKPIILVSHGPLQQAGTLALDRTLEQDNVGDPAMAAFAKRHNIKFGLFANIREAGGRATDLGGTNLISENKPAPQLFLNAGAADSVSWKMIDNTESKGMGAVFVLDGEQASYKIKRL